MNHWIDLVADWMHREPAAAWYLLACLVVIAATFATFGR